MAIYSDSFSQILASINRLNGLNLSVDQYLFGLPSEYVPPEPDPDVKITLAQKAIDEKLNTRMMVTAKDQYSLYQGEVEVFYHRMDLSDLIRQTNLIADVMEATSTQDIINSLNKKYGLILTPADVLVRPLTDEEKDLDNNLGVVIEAMPNSWGWKGSVKVGLRRGGYKLSDYVTDLTVSAFDYPAAYSTKPFATVYSYWRDFSAYQAQLKTVEVGTDQMAAIMAVLTAATGAAWVMTPSVRNSLAGATVVAVGECAEYPETYNVQYDRFVRVSLDPVLCLGYIGDLYIHYNLPMEL